MPGERPILKQQPTAPIRWRTERIFLEAATTFDEVRADMVARLKNFRNVQSDFDLFIRWVVQPPANGVLTGGLIESLRSEAVVNRMLEEQRKEFGDGETLLWPLSLTVPTPDMQRENLYEQKTILGDYLRSVHHYQSNVEEHVSLDRFLPPSVPENLRRKLLMTDGDGNVKQPLQLQILKEVAQLGTDKLGGIDTKGGS
jgi:hypothetical protein